MRYARTYQYDGNETLSVGFEWKKKMTPYFITKILK